MKGKELSKDIEGIAKMICHQNFIQNKVKQVKEIPLTLLDESNFTPGENIKTIDTDKWLAR